MPFTYEKALKRLARHNGAKGSCWDHASNLERLNDVVQMIFERGEFSDTMEWTCLTASCCFSLPSHLESVKWAYTRCGGVPINVSDQFWASVNRAWAQSCAGPGCDQLRQITIAPSHRKRPYVGTLPALFNLAVSIELESDKDKVIAVHSSSGSEELIANPERNVCTLQTYRDIRSITKPETDGEVYLYVVNCGKFTRIATYAPGDTAPLFTTYETVMGCACSSHSIIAYSKKRFIPATKNDLRKPVPITSLNALINGYAVMRWLDAGNTDEQAKSIKMMEENLEERDQELEIHLAVAPITPLYELTAGLDPHSFH